VWASSPTRCTRFIVEPVESFRPSLRASKPEPGYGIAEPYQLPSTKHDVANQPWGGSAPPSLMMTWRLTRRSSSTTIVITHGVPSPTCCQLCNGLQVCLLQPAATHRQVRFFSSCRASAYRRLDLCSSSKLHPAAEAQRAQSMFPVPEAACLESTSWQATMIRHTGSRAHRKSRSGR
jgi:hypothetical protein